MFDGLNPAQRKAVATLKGPLLILAGAGTGKTRVVTYRIANLIRHGVRPERILAVTFTNKAAKEMQERTLKAIGKKIDAPPLVTTFHSLGVNILRAEIGRLGYAAHFAIYDRGDQEDVARAALRERNVDPAALKPSTLLHRISLWKQVGLRPQAALGQAVRNDDRLAARVYIAYEQRLRNAGALDFDDLLLCTQELFRDFPDVLARQQARWDHVLVDEYQDTSAAQLDIVRRLVQPHRNLCVVGDDDQSIYGWRGAEVRNILDFQKHFPDATVVRLEENYRSCPNILELANRLIRCNPERQDKTLRATRPANDVPRYTKFEDEAAEAQSVVRDLIATAVKEKLPYRSFAILFRTNEQPRNFEQELRKHSVPYVLVGGYSFFDRREVRDVLAYLKVIHQPTDEVSLLRIINTPSRGIGSTVVEKLIARAVAAGKTVWEVLPQAVADNVFAPKATAALRWFSERIASSQRAFARRGGLIDAARDLIHQIDYQSEIRRKFDDEREREARWESVGEVLNMLAQYERKTPAPSLAGFLDQVALDNRDDEKDRDDPKKDAVTLMTLHSAKGLEFPHVYLVGLENGILPHERSMHSLQGISEERRLAYVGVTRARDRLTLTRACHRMRFGKRQAVEASMFLPEMYGRSEAAPADAPRPPAASKPPRRARR